MLYSFQTHICLFLFTCICLNSYCNWIKDSFNTGSIYVLIRIVFDIGGEAVPTNQPEDVPAQATVEGGEAAATTEEAAAPAEGTEPPTEITTGEGTPAAPTAEATGGEASAPRSDLVPGTVPAPEEVTGLETVPEVRTSTSTA